MLPAAVVRQQLLFVVFVERDPLETPQISVPAAECRRSVSSLRVIIVGAGTTMETPGKRKIITPIGP